MWKGYRDAQCSWIQVEEELSSKSRTKEGRTAVFLVIYAPRRGHLEVYAMQQGSKVATFNVSKHGRYVLSSYAFIVLLYARVKMQRHKIEFVSKIEIKKQTPCDPVDSSARRTV
jgi:uncharacterized protein with FMN-binding domain